MLKKLAALNGVALLAMALFNFLAVQLPFFGYHPGDVSDIYANPFTPADVTFSIWSFIYLFLFLFVWRQIAILRDPTRSTPEAIGQIGWLFIGTCICNMAWLVAWQSMHIVIAFGIIFCLWILLIVIYYRLVPFEQSHWTITAPFSIYLAWVSVAALANLNVVMLDAGFKTFGLSPAVWTSCLVILGTFGGLLVLWLNRDPIFVLVVIWSFAGIYLKNSIAGGELAIVAQTAIVGMSVLAISSGVVFYQNNLLSRQRKSLEV